jgi:hypothetical protein
VRNAGGAPCATQEVPRAQLRTQTVIQDKTAQNQAKTAPDTVIVLSYERGRRAMTAHLLNYAGRGYEPAEECLGPVRNSGHDT